MYASVFYFALSLELSRELQEREFIILKKGLSLMYSITFAPRHHAALFPKPYTYQRNKVIGNKTYTISSALFMCIRTYTFEL